MAFRTPEFRKNNPGKNRDLYTWMFIDFCIGIFDHKYVRSVSGGYFRIYLRFQYENIVCIDICYYRFADPSPQLHTSVYKKHGIL